MIEFLNCAHARSQSAAYPHWVGEQFSLSHRLSANFMKLVSTSTLAAVDILWPVKFGEFGTGTA